MKNPKEEPKQETLEEAAERLYPKSSIPRKLFIRGAKWQQKRMYSEEELLELLNKREDYINSEDNIFDYQSAEEWFEQNKKKTL